MVNAPGSAVFISISVISKSLGPTVISKYTAPPIDPLFPEANRLVKEP